jgi:hypothetical protein
VDALGRMRAWGRRRVLWGDWQRVRPKRVLLASEEWIAGSRSYVYKTSAPGEYRVRLPAAVARCIQQAPQDWRAQFGRRVANVKKCTIEESGGDLTSCRLVLDFWASRSVTLSPDGVSRSDATLQSDAARALYSEVAAAWRQLTDVRFKLLAFLPAVSGIGLFQLLSPEAALSDAPRWSKALAAAFGLFITVGLFVYDRRNSELYDDLVSRGKHLEHELGASSGVFLGRLGGRWPVRHDMALFTIYLTTLAAWLAVLAAALFGALDPRF